MNQDKAEKYAKRIAQRIETQLADFFQLNVIEKLELIDKRLNYDTKNPFKEMLPVIIEDWKKESLSSDSPFSFHYIDAVLSNHLEHLNKYFYQNFIELGVLLCLFGTSKSPVFSDYRKSLLKKHNLTEKKLKEALLDLFGNFLADAKHGGKESYWNDKKKLELLALYNRFLIVIKNARRDKRMLKRKSASKEKNIERELIAKYEVPQNLMSSLFSDDTPSDVALDWAINEMRLDNSSREYLDGTILRQARKLWKDKGVLVDVSFALGQYKYYGIITTDKEEKKLLQNDLRYTRVCKNPKIEKDHINRNERYLISWSFNRE